MGGLGSLKNTQHKTHFRITHTVHHKHTPCVHGCSLFSKINKDGKLTKERRRGGFKLVSVYRLVQTVHIYQCWLHTHRHIHTLRNQDWFGLISQLVKFWKTASHDWLNLLRLHQECSSVFNYARTNCWTFSHPQCTDSPAVFKNANFLWVITLFLKFFGASSTLSVARRLLPSCSNTWPADAKLTVLQYITYSLYLPPCWSLSSLNFLAFL